MIRSQHEHSRWRTSVPLDIILVGGLTLLLGVGSAGHSGTLRAVAGLVFVVFVPGYVLLAALFPARPRPGTDAEPFPSAGLGWGERAALSVGASVALVPLVALAMAAVGAPFTGPSMRAWLVGTVLVTGAVAVARRYALPPEQRLVLPFAAFVGSVYDNTLGAPNRRDAVVNTTLAVSVLLALVSVGVAVANPQQADPYTGVILLAENDSGDLVAADYPTQYERGETHTYVVRIENNRPERRAFTVVTELQRVRSLRDGTATVVESDVVFRRSLGVDAHDTRNVELSVTPSFAGDNLRLVTFVYRGDAPANPSMESASRYVFLWVDVEPIRGVSNRPMPNRVASNWGATDSGGSAGQ